MKHLKRGGDLYKKLYGNHEPRIRELEIASTKSATGGGIEFNTDNEGGWLYIAGGNTMPFSGATADMAPSSIGLQDKSGGGIAVWDGDIGGGINLLSGPKAGTFFGGGGIQITVNGGGGIDITDNGGAGVFVSSIATVGITGDEIDLGASTRMISATPHFEVNTGIVFDQESGFFRFRVDPGSLGLGSLVYQIRPNGDLIHWDHEFYDGTGGNLVLLIEWDSLSGLHQYHMQTGAVWLSDL